MSAENRGKTYLVEYDDFSHRYSEKDAKKNLPYGIGKRSTQSGPLSVIKNDEKNAFVDENFYLKKNCKKSSSRVFELPLCNCNRNILLVNK